MNRRLEQLRKLLTDQGIEAVVINKPENIRYFSGFTSADGILVIDQTASVLLTDFRYIEQAKHQAGQFSLVEGTGNQVTTALAEIIRKLGSKVIGLEGDYATWSFYRRLVAALPGSDWVEVQLDKLRMVKDDAETAAVRTAAKIADDAFEHIITVIRPGLSEIEVAAELEYRMRKAGAEGIAFATIVASGRRGSLPHGQASGKLISRGELITMDFGAVYHGYNSDITRTVCVGKASDRQREIYDLVLKAQLAGLQAVKAGRTGREVDDCARRIITAAGFGRNFGHGLGHGVGLAIHEEPRVSPQNDSVVLQENMIVTIEPGVYIPDWGGVRIEDSVLVNADGGERLTVSQKDLIEIDG